MADGSGDVPDLVRAILRSAMLHAFEPDRVTLTYREALERVETVARWLASQGIARGDRVAVSGKNSPSGPVAYLAVLFPRGRPWVPIDYGLHDAEIENLLRASEPKFFFVDEEKYGYFSTVKAAGKVLPSARNSPMGMSIR
jgi:long-chain acyl-CoA synthetase